MIPIRIDAKDPARVAASFVRMGVHTQAAAYVITKKFGGVLKQRVESQAAGASAKYRSSVRLQSTGARGNPRTTVSRTLSRRQGRGRRPGFLKMALKQTAPEYVAAIAAIPMNLDD